MMPGLAGMKIYFTERPEIELTLWIGGMFDLIGIPLIGWIIQKLVVDNIVCYGCKLGPNFEGKVGMDIWGNEHPVAGQVAKTLLLKARDRKRNAEADLDTSMSMACRISVKLVSALHLPAGDVYCIFKYGSSEQVEMPEPPEGITCVSLCPAFVCSAGRVIYLEGYWVELLAFQFPKYRHWLTRSVLAFCSNLGRKKQHRNLKQCGPRQKTVPSSGKLRKTMMCCKFLCHTCLVMVLPVGM